MSRSFTGSPAFPEGAKVSLANPQLRANLARATTTIRDKRNLRVAELENWEELRLAGEAIKVEALAHLGELLPMFEANVIAAGGTVHWALNADQAQRIVVELVSATTSKDVVKVKSMTTAEIDLNSALEAAGITAYETDLAELIVQLGDDLPSHIVVPAIHRSRDEVRATFIEHMGEWGLPAPEGLSNAPDELARAARLHLRQRFLSSRVGISGANFLVADTGSVAIVESEGNGRMCLTLPHTLITIAGIDKIIPRFEDLDVFFQVLPRSATGERMNPYNSTWTGVREGDGPQEFHVVLLDNGRSSALADRVGREALRCIRCAACLNVCPVYERVGGHAYGSVYPGPIGAVLTPQLNHVASDEVATSLPYASTLCGACFDACPVRIDIPRLLIHLRGEIVDSQRAVLPKSQEQVMMRAASWIFGSPRRLSAAASFGALMNRLTRGRAIPLPGWLSGWSKFRSTPMPSEASFASWWRADRGAGSAPVSSPDEAQPRISTHQRIEPHALGIRPRHRSLPSTGKDTRERILASVSFANATRQEPAAVPRTYRRPARAEILSTLELFTQRVNDYQARVTHTTDANVAASIAEALRSRGSSSVVIPGGLPTNWLSEHSGGVIIDDGATDVETLDATDAVVTGCAAAIAETGTVILNSLPDQGRRIISLIPDHHVVIVRQSQIVSDVPEVISKLDTSLAQTWISGPSATSDIELSRVEGVHGPRKLDVIVLTGL